MYEDIFAALDKNRIKYAVVGGVAVVLHGFTRFTIDLDLMVKLSDDNLGGFFDIMLELGYRPKAPVKKAEFMNARTRQEWIDRKGMIVFSFFHLKDHLKLVDVFITEPIKFSEIERGLLRLTIAGMTVPVISNQHLRKLKRMAGRPQDLIDIKNLEEIERINNEKRKKH